MPLNNISQPDIIPINDRLRLRKYDGNYRQFLPGYQDPVVYQNSEGIFDEAEIPNLDYVERMCTHLSRVGEMYYIEAKIGGRFSPIGDVTAKPENPPIAIWNEKFRGMGIGTLAMQAVIKRLKELGFEKITGSTVYVWNTASQRLHEKLGFRQVRTEGDDIFYELDLR